MKSNRIARTTMLCGAVLCCSATITWASCDNKDRPKTPTNLKMTQGVAAGSFTLFWTNNQTRTGLTYFNIFVRGPNNQDLHKDVIGGAGQAIRNGGEGHFSFSNVPAVASYTITMRARTKAGNEGCLSATDLEALHVKGPLGGSAPPKGLPGTFPGGVGR